MRLVAFTIEIYYDARSSKRQISIVFFDSHCKTLYDQISPGQELQARTRTHTHTHTHTHTTDDNDIRPHTVQEHNKRTSTEFSLLTT